MPRPEPPKYPNKKIDEFYNSGENYRTSEDYREMREAVVNTFDAITRMFWNPTTQKSHISKDLIRLLEPIWDHEIAPLLIREFGQNTPLSVIFYQGNDHDEILMEIWDPGHATTKSSQVFTIRGVPNSEIRYFARTRDQAPILNLRNWI